MAESPSRQRYTQWLQGGGAAPRAQRVGGDGRGQSRTCAQAGRFADPMSSQKLVQSKIARAHLTPFEHRRPSRDGCERERDERVVSRERKAEEAPGRVVAAHDRDRLQLVEEPARRAEIRERAGALLRP